MNAILVLNVLGQGHPQVTGPATVLCLCLLSASRGSLSTAKEWLGPRQSQSSWERNEPQSGSHTGQAQRTVAPRGSSITAGQYVHKPSLLGDKASL